MDYNKIGMWSKGYLDAIHNGENVTRSQLELLISRIKEMIDEIEEKTEEKKVEGNEEIEDDDLPF